MRLLIIISLVLPFGALQAQKTSLGMEGYVGSFDMSSLKQYQAVSENYYIPFKTVQDFPVRPGIRIIGSMDVVEQYTTGILCGFISTGSRLAYSDFTGQAYRDAIVNGLQLGSYNRYTVFNYKKLSLSLRMNFGAVFSNIKIDRRVLLTQTGYETREISYWKSVNFYSEIGVEGGYTIDRFFFKAFTSYEFDASGAVKDQKLEVNWSGLRAGIGVDYKFLKRN